MKNKNITRIIYGTVAIIVIAIAVLMLKNQKKDNGGEWELYKNEELNIETKVPAGVEIEIEK
ncbi:hypothetical protein A2Y83_04790 [Candidatus Falkowbacteria bacterium RBG_13_39_14]|uniref:Uncharacterized protein n=1 Tax=Candidatus Falkowbacteria bacterium RBG_13_39_14 TaxID=1797985 RepID=A0A1F5S175_9BACT|nr:MAG: hypothetical protein A2Y83_04790 [Candidatus Falkowbacteria bacterium RBG_13_39_14]